MFNDRQRGNMESSTDAAQQAKILAGFKGGPMFKNMVTFPSLHFVDAVPAEIKAKSGHKPVTIGTLTKRPY